MGSLEEEGLKARQNVELVKGAGRAVGSAAGLAGLKAFNWLFRPWSIALIVAVISAAVWGTSAYSDYQKQKASEQWARDQMAQEFAVAIGMDQLGMSDRMSMGLKEVDIRSGRCTFVWKTVSCVYGDFVISDGKLVKQ